MFAKAGFAKALTVLAALLAGGQAFAQPSTPPPEPATGPTAPGTETTGGGERPLQRSELETFYLIDAQGKLIPFSDMPFEEFEAIYKLYKEFKTPEQPQRYVIQRTTVTGSAAGEQAQLEFRFQVRVQSDGWVRIPLRLNAAVLREPPRATNAEQFFTAFDKEGDGYVGWLRGSANQTYDIDLKVFTPVRRVGSEHHVQLDVPRSTSSQLALDVPGDDIEAHVGVDNTAVLQETKKLSGNRTQIVVVGLDGTFELSWRANVKSSPTPPPALAATSNILVKFEGRSRVICDARISVAGFRARTPVDSFRVSLPRGMKFIPTDQAGIEARVIEPQGESDPQIIEVKLLNPSARPNEIQLLAEMTRSDVELDSPIELAGFAVADAISQTGTINLAVGDDWAANWTLGPNIDRLEELPEALQREKVVARFRYLRQPFSLQVQVNSKQTTINVEPQHTLFVEAEQVRLEAKLKCYIRGAKTDRIELSLVDGNDSSVWVVERVETAAADLLDVEKLKLDAVQPFVIQLARPITGQIEVTVRVRRKLDRDSGKLLVHLPQPRASLVGPASVTVLAAANIELTPTMEEISGLNVEATTPPTAPPPGWRTVAAYRQTTGENPAIFAANVNVRSRSVSVSATGMVRFSAYEVALSQRLTYDIQFEPLQQLSLALPRSVVDSETLEIQSNGNKLTWSEAEANASGAASGEQTMVVVQLPESRMGEMELDVRYVQPLPELTPEKSATLVIPLAIPVGVDKPSFTFQSLTVSFPDSLKVEAGKEPWTSRPLAFDRTSWEHSLELTAKQYVSSIAFDVTVVGQSSASPVVVQRAWVQTWWMRSGRQDRAAIRLTSNNPVVDIELPPGAMVDDVAVDAHRATNDARISAAIVSVPLPDHQLQREYVVEVWYSFPEARTPSGLNSVDLPRIVGARWSRRIYWQLVVPQDLYVLTGPHSMTTEQTWDWEGLLRVPATLLSQRDLENWVGATRQTAVPDSTNQYLYSAFGTIDRVEFRAANRHDLLLAVSAVVFAGGMLLLYVPMLRRPFVLFLLGVALLVGGLLYPDPALQIAQVASVGLLCVLIAQIMRWTIARARPSRPVIHGTSVTMDPGTTRSRIILSTSDSHASTKSAPMPLQVTEPESKE